MSLLIKICGLRNVGDVAAAVAAGANAVGFVFAESVRRVTPAQARLACADLPSDIKRVAVMLHPAQKELYGILEEFKPDVVQTDIEDFRDVLVPTYVEQWPVIREGNVPQKMPATFLYEGAKSGQGKTVDWKRAQALTHRGNMILAGGLSAENVAEAISNVRPYGIDVSSGVESAPGIKDPQKINQFVSAARAAEKNL
jgi:phosphoribosylanthranilate isomerase